MRPFALTLCSPPIVILNLSFVATGDGTCVFAGYVASSSDRPSSGTNTWSIFCDNSWTDVSVTIVDVATCPVGQEPNTSGDGYNSCPVGEYRDSISTASCTPCATGRYNPSSGSTSSDACLPCGAGERSSVGSSVCSVCPTGTYTSSTGSSDCNGLCSAGKSTTGDSPSDHDEASDCTLCEIGTFSGDGEACSACENGKFSPAGATFCTSCEAGKYSESTGDSAACQDCPAGSYTMTGAR